MGLTKQQEHWDLFELSEYLKKQIEQYQLEMNDHKHDFYILIELQAKVSKIKEIIKYCEARWKD